MIPESIALSILIPVSLCIILMLVRRVIILHDQLRACEQEVKSCHHRLSNMKEELMDAWERASKAKKKMNALSLGMHRGRSYLRGQYRDRPRLLAMDYMRLQDD